MSSEWDKLWEEIGKLSQTENIDRAFQIPLQEVRAVGDKQQASIQKYKKAVENMTSTGMKNSATIYQLQQENKQLTKVNEVQADILREERGKLEAIQGIINSVDIDSDKLYNIEKELQK